MKQLAEFVAQSRKAVVGLVVSFTVASLAARGVDVPPDVVAALTGLATALTVWMIPNQGG
jgi:hypothetical protein